MRPHISRTPASICITIISARNYIPWTTFLLLTVWVYLHSFSCCSLPNAQNYAKFRENSTLQQFKVIQGHRSWCQSALLVINSNFGRILHRFRDIAAQRSKNRFFALPHPHLTSPLGGPRQNFSMKLTPEKLEGWGYCMVKIALS